METPKQALIRRYFDAWVRKDASDLDAFFATEATYSECYGPEYRGLGQIKRWFSDWNQVGSVLEWRIKSFVEQGDSLAVEWYFQCGYGGEVSGFDGMTLARFDEHGKIASLKEFESRAEHRYPYGRDDEAEKLSLVEPSEAFLDQVAAYRQEFLDVNGSLDGSGALKNYDDPKAWLAAARAYANKSTVPEGYVQATQWLYMRESDGALLGMLQVRHELNEYLAKYGGHIGYSVRPKERRRGYATRMLHDALPYCKALGLNKVLITCLQDNEGSRRTILANGGVYESTVTQPSDGEKYERYWIAL